MTIRKTYCPHVVAGLLVAGMAASPPVQAAPAQGAPFEQLRSEIDALGAQVRALAEQVDQSGGGDQVATVHCPDDSLEEAIAGARPGGKLLVTVFGICQEDVTIERDDVVVRAASVPVPGQAPIDGVSGQITIDGARRVVIEGLWLSGPGSGVESRRNAVVSITDSTIENNAAAGIDVTQGSFATIEGNTIRANGSCEIMVRDSGHARVLNNTVEYPAGLPAKSASCNALVGAFRASRIRMVGGNTIVNNVEPGFAVDVEHGSTFRQDGGHDTFDGDVRVANTSNADFRDALISGGLSVFQNSNLRVRNSDVAGGVLVGTRSLAVLNRSATVAGNVNCLGSGTVGLNPPTGLTLVAGGVPVTTSAGGLGWAYRAAVFGSPTFVAGGRFVGCN